MGTGQPSSSGTSTEAAAAAAGRGAASDRAASADRDTPDRRRGSPASSASPRASVSADPASAAATSAPRSWTSCAPRSASGEPINGYQVIQQIAERSNGAWRPSPGSVYPTIQQLEDEGLLEADDSRGRRSLKLTDEGQTYVEEHGDELAAVWTPFEERERQDDDAVDLKPEIGQVMGAVWQIVTTGSDQQRRDAADVLVDTRRRLYGLLAEGDQAADAEDES